MSTQNTMTIARPVPQQKAESVTAGVGHYGRHEFRADTATVRQSSEPVITAHKSLREICEQFATS